MPTLLNRTKTIAEPGDRTEGFIIPGHVTREEAIRSDSKSWRIGHAGAS